MLAIHDANFQLDQAPVLSFELKNDSARVLLSSFGATLQSFEISVPGFEKRDVVLGYSDWVTYKELFDQKQSAYFGTIVGPIANLNQMKEGIYCMAENVIFQMSIGNC